MMTELGKNTHQAIIIIKAWPYKEKDIEEYCKRLGKNLNELTYFDAELMISELNLGIYAPKS